MKFLPFLIEVGFLFWWISEVFWFLLVLFDEVWFEEVFSVLGVITGTSVFDEVVSGCEVDLIWREIL